LTDRSRWLYHVVMTTRGTDAEIETAWYIVGELARVFPDGLSQQQLEERTPAAMRVFVRMGMGIAIDARLATIGNDGVVRSAGRCEEMVAAKIDEAAETARRLLPGNLDLASVFSAADRVMDSPLGTARPIYRR
jgi:hypothetical protein